MEGRQQEVRLLHGVHFINDTTATIPEAAVAAIKRFRPKARRLILIAGGQDKNLDFRELQRSISKWVNVLVMLPGTATKKILPRTGRRPEPRYAKSMQEAVKIACENAGKGDYILLSPGAASFGLFLNEFDRGEKFVDAVNRLNSKR